MFSQNKTNCLISSIFLKGFFLSLGNGVVDELFMHRKNINKLLLKYHPDKPGGSNSKFIDIRNALTLLAKKSPNWQNEVTTAFDIKKLLCLNSRILKDLEQFMKPKKLQTKKSKRENCLTFSAVVSKLAHEMDYKLPQTVVDNELRMGNIHDLILEWAKTLLWYKVCLQGKFTFHGFTKYSANGALVPIDFDWMAILLQHLEQISTFGKEERSIKACHVAFK